MHLLHMLANDFEGSSLLLPRAASNLSHGVDWAWNVILGITTLFFCIVIGTMIVFLLKYRRRTPDDATPEITHNTPLEVCWTVIPLIIVISIFFVGFHGFLNYDTPPSNARVIDVEGHRWGFILTYPNGATSADLYLEKDVPVRLDLHSSDVLHAFYVPAFRTQRNLIFGRTTNIWFVPEELSPVSTGKDDPGGFNAFCTQYCGQGHSKMGARVFVLAKADYDQKMTELANPFKETDPATKKSRWVPYAELGHKLYSTSAGCMACHTVDGKLNTGPTWFHLWKSDVNFSVSNEPGFAMHTADSDEKWTSYIRESILHPDVKVVAGFQNVMPQQAATFAGDPGSVKDEKLRAMIEFIKSIGTEKYQPPIPLDSPLYDADKYPNHPESLAGLKAAATQK